MERPGGCDVAPARKPQRRSQLGVARKRELVDTGASKRFVRRTAKGRFGETGEVGRSLSADRHRKATTVAKRGQGDRGDRRR